MVKTYEQAQRIQAKRRDAGKMGVADAVRRFIKRTGTPMDCGLAPIYNG
ncbi:hypothetical protein [Massilia eurypsychrophila]|nr:hypothetical protein [Massilia eurypsychrophila]